MMRRFLLLILTPLAVNLGLSPASAEEELSLAQQAARMAVTAELCQRWAGMFPGDDRIAAIKERHKDDAAFSEEYARSAARFENYKGAEDGRQFRRLCEQIGAKMDELIRP